MSRDSDQAFDEASNRPLTRAAARARAALANRGLVTSPSTKALHATVQAWCEAAENGDLERMAAEERRRAAIMRVRRASESARRLVASAKR